MFGSTGDLLSMFAGILKDRTAHRVSYQDLLLRRALRQRSYAFINTRKLRTAIVCILRFEKKVTEYRVSHKLRPALQPADYFWENAYEIRGGAGGPPLPTSSHPKGWVMVGVRVGVGSTCKIEIE